MSFLKQLKKSIEGYTGSFSFVSQHKLWVWFIIPAILNLIMFIASGWLAWIYSDELTNAFLDLFSITDENVSNILFWIILLFIRILIAFFYILIYKYVLLILFAPALALFAEKIYAIQTNKESHFELRTFLNNVFRGITLALKNLFKELILTILVSLLSFTGVLAPLVPIGIFNIQSYYYGFSMMDYFCELEGMGVKESSTFVWKNKGIALGNGAIFNVMLFIPFLGVLIGPMIALVAVFQSLKNINPDSDLEPGY